MYDIGPNYCIIFWTTRVEAGPPDSQGWWSGGPLSQNVDFEPCISCVILCIPNEIYDCAISVDKFISTLHCQGSNIYCWYGQLVGHQPLVV